MSPVAPPLPAGAFLGFSYEYGVDIDTAYNAANPVAPVWQPIRRISAVVPGLSPVTQPAQTYDDFGAPNDQKTSEAWTLGYSVQVNRLPSGLFAPEVEALKAYTEPDAVGSLSIAHLRWYDKPVTGTPNPGEAYEGFGYVGIERGSTDNAGVGTWNVTVTGQGKRLKITNPFGGWAAVVPTVTSVLPSGAAAGAQVTIKGTGFAGIAAPTGVKFGATNATSYVVIDGYTIVAVLPAGSAGATTVTVTSTAGASNALAYTRAA